MNSLIRILLLSIYSLGLSGQIKESADLENRIPVGTTPWRTEYDIIDGWDWSLPLICVSWGPSSTSTSLMTAWFVSCRHSGFILTQ